MRGKIMTAGMKRSCHAVAWGFRGLSVGLLAYGLTALGCLVAALAFGRSFVFLGLRGEGWAGGSAFVLVDLRQAVLWAGVGAVVGVVTRVALARSDPSAARA
jgi:hypothetical protein